MTIYDHESSSVQTHLRMLQDVIQRMAENSRSCKTWCVTVAAAVLFLVARSGVVWYVLIVLVPVFLFFILDVYYLYLERRFRLTYGDKLAKLRHGTYGAEDVFVVEPAAGSWRLLLRCLASPSVWSFYPATFAVVLVAYATYPLWSASPNS